MVSANIQDMSDNQALAATYYVKHVTIISVFCGLASVAVILRVWARRIQKTSLDLSDHLIFFGLVRAILTVMLDFVHLIVSALCSRGKCRQHIW